MLARLPQTERPGAAETMLGMLRRPGARDGLLYCACAALANLVAEPQVLHACLNV